ncbi:hypothetical protein K8942_04020 [Candidatus Peribacteria bacterium]|nr:MAG: hypothetical protein K8942_04020 [Candidatus Peribacteria bacterium]
MPSSSMRFALCLTSFFLSVLIGTGSVSAADAPVPDKRVRPGARGVLMLSYPLREGCHDFTLIRNMTLLYEGTSPANIRRVYAKVLGKKLTTKRAINAENYTVTLWFDPKNAPGLCYSRSIEIYADFSGTAEPGSMHSLQVELPTDVVTDSGVIGEPTHGLWVKVLKKTE